MRGCLTLGDKPRFLLLGEGPPRRPAGQLNRPRHPIIQGLHTAAHERHILTRHLASTQAIAKGVLARERGTTTFFSPSFNRSRRHRHGTISGPASRTTSGTEKWLLGRRCTRMLLWPAAVSAS